MFKYRPAVFLDRDGVVNQVVYRSGVPASPMVLNEFVWMNGIGEAVHQFKAAFMYVFVISNQPEVSRRKLSLSALEKISDYIRRTLPVDDILICPHDEGDGCGCRKPQPGMILSLAALWRVDLGRSFLIGDSWRDMMAGNLAGCRTILIEKDYNRDVVSDYRVKRVEEAVPIVLHILRLGV